MKLVATWFAGILALLAAVSAQAQVQVKFSQARTLYLQYESIDLTLSLTNVSDAPVNLAASDEGKSWLSFLVFNRGGAGEGSFVEQVRDVAIDPVRLLPGETKQVTVNIMPYYAIRSTGGYSAQAVVNIPGLAPLMTGKLYFTVGKGEQVWKQETFNLGVKRVYKLIRFLDVHDANLYLRVEEPDQNLVYSTVRLGRLVAFAEPAVEFDAAGNIHIVQVTGSHYYRYTAADANGRILKQEDRSAMAGAEPTVVKAKDGTVQFVGGFSKQMAAKRAKLSETQELVPAAGPTQ
jgi:hypothetical protein